MKRFEQYQRHLEVLKRAARELVRQILERYIQEFVHVGTAIQSQYEEVLDELL